MLIPAERYAAVRAVDVDDHETHFAYQYWKDDFKGNRFLLPQVERVEEFLGQTVTRTELVDLYRNQDVPVETKFIATMIWGHEAPAGSRRDSRGPWKVSRMFSDPAIAVDAIQNVSISDPEAITKSYRLLNKVLERCGPNFFTKHFYFLGKSQRADRYPLIFDDRVASGLVKLSSQDSEALDMVRVSAQRAPDAYLQYLDWVHGQADQISCAPDQIEYYLFTL